MSDVQKYFLPLKTFNTLFPYYMLNVPFLYSKTPDDWRFCKNSLSLSLTLKQLSLVFFYFLIYLEFRIYYTGNMSKLMQVRLDQIFIIIDA